MFLDEEAVQLWDGSKASHTLLDNSRNVCLEPPDPALKEKYVNHVYTHKTRLYT